MRQAGARYLLTMRHAASFDATIVTFNCVGDDGLQLVYRWGAIV